ncbi:PAS domain S-box protein [Flavihumibacter sp. R14]|nr:PAS domain S-box protein [Flavihumibacter soli]
MNSIFTYDQLQSENEELRQQLEEAHDAINAIRTGKIDALIVQGENGQELYTLRSADRTYRVFIEKMSEGAVTLNPDGTILYSNNRFATMLSVSLEKVIGKHFSTFLPNSFKSNYESLLKDGWKQDLKMEISLLRSDNHLVPCLISCNRIELDEKIALSLILTDLTEQKEAEKQLLIKNQQLEQAELKSRVLNDQLAALIEERTRELYLSREQFKFLADQLPVLVWTAKPEGTIDYFNKRWYEYTGKAHGEISGWESVLHPDDIQLTHDRWQKSVLTGNPYEIEHRFKRASDQNYRWHLGYALPFKDENQKIIAWFGTGTDIEEQKQAIEKRDEFIGIASHELKTPLTTVKAYLEIIGKYRKEPLPSAIKEYVSKAQGALAKLQNLVNDLLDVSKIHAGQLLYDKIEFNLIDLVNNCIENFNHLYPQRKLVCSCEERLIVYGNQGRIEQVIMNLISNAVKYSGDSTDITIQAYRKNDKAVVSLIDSGIGLTEEQKNRIFERFYRVEDKKFLTSGLGMGLYISSEIIKSHGGRLVVSSNFGEGSKFSIELPLMEI